MVAKVQHVDVLVSQGNPLADGRLGLRPCLPGVQVNAFMFEEPLSALNDQGLNDIGSS